MKQFSKREIVRLMKNNGYYKVRQNGSHSTWSDGKNTITLPSLYNIHSVVIMRLIKENGLKSN